MEDMMTKTIFALLAAAFAVTTLGSLPASAKTDGLWSDAGATVMAERRKPRVKGGSGCDDPGDILEHPECR
jgi:hypothetical protein